MYSYLDAGTGSMILAALTAGTAGITVLLKIYWHRILGLFSNKHRLAAEQAALELQREQPDAGSDDSDSETVASRATSGTE